MALSENGKTILIVILIAFLAASSTQAKEKTYSIVGVGDIVTGLNYPDTIAPRIPAKDGLNLFSKVSGFISKADVAVGNLEGVLLNKGGKPKGCKNPKYQHLFRMPEHHARLLAKAGFDFMSVANNHARDFGLIGLKSTFRTLKRYGLSYAGVKNECETAIIVKNGIRYGFCAFAHNATMVSIFDYDYAKRLVRQLKHRCDIVIVSIHGGAEGSSCNHVYRKQELYAGEKRGDVYRFAHCVIDAGADVVFGHGPHVVRGLELYKNRLIAYSLGNFCTPYGVSKLGRLGYAPMVCVEVNAKGEFHGGTVVSAIQTGPIGPVPDAKREVVNEIIKLSKGDFPESKLKIELNGKLHL